MKTSSLILGSVVVMLLATSCATPETELDVDDTSGDSAQIASTEGQFELAPTEVGRFEQLLSFTTERQFPFQCGDLNPDRTAEIPTQELVEEFIVSDEEYAFHLPAEIPYEWFTGVDATSHAALLTYVKRGEATLLFYGYEWDDGYNEYMGVNILIYNESAELVGTLNLCEYDQIEKSGMQAYNILDSKIDENGLITSLFHHSWTEDSGDGGDAYTKSVYQIGADGRLETISTEEGDAETGEGWFQEF